MAPEVDAAKGEFIAKTNELANKTNEANDKYGELIKKVNQAIEKANWFTRNVWFLNDDVDKLSKLATEVLKKLNELREQIAKIVRGSIPVFSLYDAAFRWTNNLQAPISATAGVAGAPATLSVRSQWEGPAALAYFTTVLPMQGSAVTGLSNTASSTSKWLADVASNNLNFMVKILLPVLQVLDKIIAAFTAGVTVAGLLEAIGRIGDALGKAITAVFEIVTETAKKIGETIGMANAAKNIANDNVPFPGTHWPNPVTI